jgi:uncharacterized protein YegP (UPF0339 family)
MERLSDAATVSDARAMDRAAFQVHAGGDNDWAWRFVRPDGTVVADSARTYRTRDEAVTDIESEISGAAAAADVSTFERLALQVDERGDRYSWRMLDARRETVATSSGSHVERSGTVEAVEMIQGSADEATVFELSGATFQLRNVDDAWEWRLVDGERTPIMLGPGRYESRQVAETAIDDVKDVIETADVLDYEGAAFELYETAENRWKWQLVDENGTVMASSAGDYTTRDAAREALGAIRDELDDASILEIETAAFEIQEDEGWWRWRLIDEDGNPIAESVREYDSRREARESMEVLQEYAPDAMISVAE